MIYYGYKYKRGQEPSEAEIYQQAMDMAESQELQVFHYRCPQEGCDNRPFEVTSEDLKDAEGEIWCEYCDTVCEAV